MNYIWRILRYTASLWPYYLLVSVFSVLVSIMSLSMPLLTGWAIDEMRKGTLANVHYVLWLAVGIFLLDIGGTVISNINAYYGDQMSAKLQAMLSARYYQHLLTLPQKYFDTELSGKIINRLNRSINQISSFMQMFSNNFLQFIFSTIFALAIVAFYSWQIALLLLSLYPIYIWMTVRTSGKWLNYQNKKNKHLDIASGRFTEAIQQIKVVKSFVQEERELGVLTKNYNKMVKINAPQSKFWHTRDIMRRSILNVVFFAIYILIFTQGAKGVFTPGESVTLILYAMQIRIPIFTISFLVENTQKAVGDSKDYFEVMGVKPDIKDAQDASLLKVSQGKIDFKGVEFGYTTKKVIKNINFTIEPDSKVALVGESGEGKTTLTNLLLRLYKPNQGSILIDNQDIASVTQQSLREQIGVVFQEPALFSGTIKENIAYSRPGASDEDIIKCAKMANAHEFITKFENGYSTEIGEHGLKLSGGQKQRIAIARALLKDAPILILDEATSSLDSKSEHMVQEALERLMKGRTTIIIAHRLSTIQNVDYIITLKNGSVDEIGSPKELAKSGGIYEQLLEIQSIKNKEISQKKLHTYDLTN